MQAHADKREFLAPKEIARELRIHVSSVYRAIERGELPAIRLSETGALRVPRSALQPREQHR